MLVSLYDNQINGSWNLKTWFKQVKMRLFSFSVATRLLKKLISIINFLYPLY
jgi:hypothetical protein